GQCEKRRTKIGLAGGTIDDMRQPIACMRQADEPRNAVEELPRRLVGARPDRARQPRCPRESGVVIAEDDDHRFVEKAAGRKRRYEIVERLIEEPHRVKVVAERRPFEGAELHHFVARREIVEWMMERKRDEPGAERLRQLLETWNH